MLTLTLLAALSAYSSSGSTSVSLRNVGNDPLAVSGTETGTAVGPVNASNGSVAVSVYQLNRYSGDGGAAMGFSTSTNDGDSWTEGVLPGITKAQNSSNPYDRVAYQTIAWNAKYRDFVVATLPIVNIPSAQDGDTTLSPIVSLSSDGVNWSAPIVVESTAAQRPEKSYVACDNNSKSPHYGSCYIAWDDNDNNDLLYVNTSLDGGKTWGNAVTPPDLHSEFGALPVIQPNGNVVIVSEDSSGFDFSAQNQISFVSTNGGASFSAANEISPFVAHAVAGPMRTQALPTAVVDPQGTIYDVWQDCRYRTSCSSNDLVLSTSPDGVSWTAPTRIALDSVTSGADHFLPTLAIQSSSDARLALSYYGFPNANCTAATCALMAYESESTNSGSVWSTPVTLSAPMNVQWLASTGPGYMVGDYFEGTFKGTSSIYYAPLSLATAPSSGPSFNETIKAAKVTHSVSSSNIWSALETFKHRRPALLAHRHAPFVWLRHEAHSTM